MAEEYELLWSDKASTMTQPFGSMNKAAHMQLLRINILATASKILERHKQKVTILKRCASHPPGGPMRLTTRLARFPTAELKD